jgi:hypothetical protein
MPSRAVNAAVITYTRNCVLRSRVTRRRSCVGRRVRQVNNVSKPAAEAMQWGQTNAEDTRSGGLGTISTAAIAAWCTKLAM